MMAATTGQLRPSLATKMANGTGGNEPQPVPQPSANSKSEGRLSYSREFLVKLKDHPRSRERPALLDTSHMVSKVGLWDPEHWHSSDSKQRLTAAPAGPASQLGGKEDAQDKVGIFFYSVRRAVLSGARRTLKVPGWLWNAAQPDYIS